MNNVVTLVPPPLPNIDNINDVLDDVKASEPDSVFCFYWKDGNIFWRSTGDRQDKLMVMGALQACMLETWRSD